MGNCDSYQKNHKTFGFTNHIAMFLALLPRITIWLSSPILKVFLHLNRKLALLTLLNLVNNRCKDFLLWSHRCYDNWEVNNPFQFCKNRLYLNHLHASVSILCLLISVHIFLIILKNLRFDWLVLNFTPTSYMTTWTVSTTSDIKSVQLWTHMTA